MSFPRLAAVVGSAALAFAALHPRAARAEWLTAPSALNPQPLPSLDGATAWINSPPLNPQALRGKVVLVDFWTYSCINCLRTLPYLRAWAEKYGPSGLVVIGAHTPEFDFERALPNVQRAVKDLKIDYPVAVDSQRAIWNAFGTRAWPSFYFVDASGRVRSRQLGEGRYDQAERLIQQLLHEAGRPNVPSDLVTPQAEGTQAAAGPRPADSDETYLGSARAEGFVADTRALRLNEWTRTGRWTVGPEQIEGAQAGGRISYRFRARDLHLVLGPGRDGRPVRFRITIDGKPPGVDHGSDVAADGTGRVDAYRLYQLVRQALPEAPERLFEIEFLDPGVRAHAFTFG